MTVIPARAYDGLSLPQAQPKPALISFPEPRETNWALGLALATGTIGGLIAGSQILLSTSLAQKVGDGRAVGIAIAGALIVGGLTSGVGYYLGSLIDQG